MTELKDKKIIYTFDTWDDYDGLMQYLEDEGVTWIDGTKPTQWKRFDNLLNNIHRILITLKNGKLTYADGWDASFCLFKDFENVHWKKGKKKDISLAEFLGWEEGAIYKLNDLTGLIYKIKNDKIYISSESIKDWSVFFNCEDFRRARKTEKYEPKYMIKTPFVSDKGPQYLSCRTSSGIVFIASEIKNNKPITQKFTKEEVDKLVREYKLNDLFEIVEVVE